MPTSGSVCVQFVTLLSRKAELGTITWMFWPVRTRVLRSPMRSTVPWVSSTWTMSPFLIGRSASRISPLMKLLTMF